MPIADDFFLTSWDRRHNEVTDGEMDANLASVGLRDYAEDKIGEKLEFTKDLIQVERKSSNYHTTKEQDGILNSVFAKVSVLCQNFEIPTATLDVDSVTVVDLPRMLEILKGKLDGILRKGLTKGLELKKHTHLMELAEHIQNEAEFPGASGTYSLLLELYKWENQVKAVISQQVCLESRISAVPSVTVHVWMYIQIENLVTNPTGRANRTQVGARGGDCREAIDVGRIAGS